MAFFDQKHIHMLCAGVVDPRVGGNDRGLVDDDQIAFAIALGNLDRDKACIGGKSQKIRIRVFQIVDEKLACAGSVESDVMGISGPKFLRVAKIDRFSRPQAAHIDVGMGRNRVVGEGCFSDRPEQMAFFS